MKNLFKKLFSLLLVLAMVGSMFPAVAASGEDNEFTQTDYASVDALFDQLDQMESEPVKKNASQTQVTDAAQAMVMESEDYVEGSLERNGNVFTWWTESGVHCVYNPQMREKHKNMTGTTIDAIVNEPVATKGGWPSGNQVYLIGPYYGVDSTFTNQYKNEATAAAKAIGDTDGYTLYSGKSCTVDKVAEAVSKGAIVFFDSHGTTDYENPEDEYEYVTGATSSYLCLTSTSGLTTEDYNDGALYFSDGICINGATIANHMTSNSPGGIVWMAICLGMATDTMCAPLRSRGVEVVYGYSQSVTFGGDYCYEEVFWDNMYAGNTVAASISAMKSKYGNWDCSPQIGNACGWSSSDIFTTISEARTYYCAFPIVVSDEDVFPGQRSSSSYGADTLQTVKSTYTLYSQYQVTATSNNTAYGSVSVSGNTITATPETGYFAQNATVLSGTATVTQNGNSFLVNASSDCSIQINFAPKTAVTVSFSGANIAAQTGYAGDTMTLPTVTAPEGYTFLGWMSNPLSGDTTEKPAYFDSFIPTASTTVYALYSYVDENSGSGTGDYVKVTTEPADWSGEYVIVYEDESCIFDSSLSSLDKTNNYQEVTIANQTIAAAEADPYKFTIEAMDGGYSIKSVSGSYIGGKSGSNTLTTGSSPLLNTIAIDAAGNATIVSNTSHLRFNSTLLQNRFRYYKAASYENQNPVALYLKDGSAGTTYYTGSFTKCEHANTTNHAATQPTCTENGFTAGTYCLDCESYVSGHTLIPALGHSYEAIVTPPTTYDQGYTTYTCACGNSYVGDYTEALGQVFTVRFSLPEGVAAVANMACGKAGITLPDAAAPTGYTFAGWSTAPVEETETAPALQTAGSTYYATENTTLYAVYTYTVGGSGTTEYKLTDIADIKTGDVFVITMQYKDSTVYALPNDGGTSTPDAIIISASNGKLTTEPASNLLWNLGGTSSGYSFYPNGSTSKWLYCTSTNKGVKVGTDSANTFVIDSSSGYLKHSGTNRYVGVYRTKPDWRCYTSPTTNIGDQTLGFYVKSAAGTTYYTSLKAAEPMAAVYTGTSLNNQYTTFEDAIANCATGSYVKLLADVEAEAILEADLYIDLNGFTLSGILDADGYKIYGMDSTTDSYNGDSVGYFSCVDMDDQPVVPESVIKTDVTGFVRRYMAIESAGSYSFHRFYLGITHMSVKPGTNGVGYKALFCGDDAVKAQLSAYGYSLQLGTENTPVTVTKAADSFVSLQTVTLRVDHYNAEKYGEEALTAKVMLTLKDGTVIESAACSKSLRQMLETVNDNAASFTEAQLTAIRTMIQNNPIMSSWNVGNI